MLDKCLFELNLQKFTSSENTMLAAILFDLDGTLANTDPVHYIAWREMLLDYGIEINEEIYKTRFTGRLNPQIVQDFLPQLSPAEGAKLADDKEALFRQMAPNMKPTPGLAELLQWTQTHHIKRGLVTNAPTLNAQHMLAALGLQNTFDAIVITDEERIPGKPDPAPYQLALQKLGISPESAIALEDSPSGIRSAVAAGIRTIGVASTQEVQKLLDVGAFMAIADFTDLQLWTLLNSLGEEDFVTQVSC